MDPRRARRPTAWEVSFPDEVGEDDDDEKGEERAEREIEEVQDDLPDLNGKRKTYTSVDDRVRRTASSLLSPSWLICTLQRNSRRNATVWNPHHSTEKGGMRTRRTLPVMTSRIIPRAQTSSPNLHRILLFSSANSTCPIPSQQPLQKRRTSPFACCATGPSLMRARAKPRMAAARLHSR
jgi:hypothetical protein